MCKSKKILSLCLATCLFSFISSDEVFAVEGNNIDYIKELSLSMSENDTILYNKIKTAIKVTINELFIAKNEMEIKRAQYFWAKEDFEEADVQSRISMRKVQGCAIPRSTSRYNLSSAIYDDSSVTSENSFLIGSLPERVPKTQKLLFDPEESSKVMENSIKISNRKNKTLQEVEKEYSIAKSKVEDLEKRLDILNNGLSKILLKNIKP